MTDLKFKVHTAKTAPEAAKNVLETAKDKYGFVPNLLGVMAEAPELAKAYVAVSGLFDQTSFNDTERQVVLLTISHEHGCEYCVSAHSAVAQMNGVPEAVVQAIREDRAIGEDKLDALRKFTREVVETRGWPNEDRTRSFVDAGYGRQQILEVILAVALKTMSNYTNHIARTPLDQAFEQARWEGAA